jgi:uncharacterized protein
MAIEIVELSGRGAVYSCVALHHPQAPSFDYPIVAALVDLDEGIRLLTNLEGRPVGQVEPGERVRVRFAPTVGDYQVPVFVADDEADG